MGQAGNGVFAVALGSRRYLSRGQLTKAGGHYVDAAAEPANRQLSAGRKSVCGSPADSQQLRGPGHREQQR